MKEKIRKKKGLKSSTSLSLQLTILALPGILYYLIFCYLPMGGLVLAFKQYRYDLGIIKSPFIGFENFKFFFATNLWKTVTGNTILYAAASLITNVICSVFVAMLLMEVRRKTAIKFYQTSMYLPNFMSWVLVSFIVYLFLNHDAGILNQIIRHFGGEGIKWYNDPNYWPYILVFTNLWKSIGMNCLIYYAALLGVDREEYKAAEIDGAGKLKQMLYISVPHLVPLVSIMSILAVGNFFRGDFGLFYNVPRNMGVLYPATDVIDTFIYRGLMKNGDIGMTTAVGLFQSVMGLILVLITNTIANKIEPDNALF